MKIFITQKKVIFLLAIFFTAILFSQAFAKGAGEVRIGSQTVARFFDDGKNDPQKRAAEIQERIESLIASGLSASDIRIEKDGAIFLIYWGNEKITHVDAEQAKLNGTTPANLAKIWAKNLKTAILENGFYIYPSRLDIAVYSSVCVKAAGLATGPISKEYEEGSVEASVNQARNEITIRSKGPGRGKVVFSRGGMKAELYIRMREPAADIPEKIETEVSGSPASAEVLKLAAYNAVKTQIRPKPGVKIEIGSEIRSVLKLDKGNSTIVSVPVSIKGEDYLPVRTDVPVIVKNTGKGFGDMDVLLVSDRPESVSEDGILFKGGFVNGRPARLLYYHQNVSKANRIFWVELYNNSKEPVKVMASGAAAGPSRWGITVGHLAAIRFLENYKDSVSCTVTIQPGDSITAMEMPIPPDQVLAGYVHMEIVQGPGLEVYVLNSATEKRHRSTLPVLFQPFDPFKIHPKGIFEPADLIDEIIFAAGRDDEASCIIGKAPWLIDPATGEPNNGNYGVFYKFNIKLSNPSAKKKRVGFFFVPDSIMARGSFILGGKLMETGIVRNPEQRIFAIQDLMPGEEKLLTLITTPEGGSYYPARVLIRTVDESINVEVQNKDVDEKTEEEFRNERKKIDEDEF